VPIVAGKACSGSGEDGESEIIWGGAEVVSSRLASPLPRTYLTTRLAASNPLGLNPKRALLAWKPRTAMMRCKHRAPKTRARPQ
jgi:hypothetical protein